MTVPWSDILQHPEDFFDAARLSSVSLMVPELMNGVQALTLAYYFQERSIDDPFVFYAKDIILRNIDTRKSAAEIQRTAGDDIDDDGVLDQDIPGPSPFRGPGSDSRAVLHPTPLTPTRRSRTPAPTTLGPASPLSPLSSASTPPRLTRITSPPSQRSSNEGSSGPSANLDENLKGPGARPEIEVWW